MSEANSVQMISTENLVPHPDNPRKDLGELEELTTSIKAMGVLNPLLVIHMMDGTYRIIAGHRRAAAAKRAGVAEVPCIVTKMTELEQQYAMWTENEQRQQLTAREQAGGIQMMLDLGATMDEVAQKTGLSKKTVKARAEIARLDQSILDEMEKKKDTYQISIQDYEELARIRDVKKRNEVLKRGVYNHNDLVLKVDAVIRKEVEKKNMEFLEADMKKRGFLKSTDTAITWNTTKWETLQKIDLTGKGLKITVEPEKDRQIFYIEHYSILYIAAQRQESPEEKEKNSERAKEELERKKAYVYLESLAKAYQKELGAFILNILDKKVFCTEMEGTAIKKIWELFMTSDRGWTDAPAEKLEDFIDEWIHPEKNLSQEDLDKLVDEMIVKAEIKAQLLICIFGSLNKLYNWGGSYDPEAGKTHRKFMYLLKDLYGYLPTREEFVYLVEGTHEKYLKKEKTG